MFPTDLEIAQKAPIRPITEIAQKLGINIDDLELYGKYKAKIPLCYTSEDHIKKVNSF